MNRLRYGISVIIAAICWAFMANPSLMALEREVVISTWQGPCADGDFEANLATVREVVRLARERGSDFVVFPETFLSGYGDLETVKKGARSLDDPAVREFIAESAEHGMTVLVGIARRTGDVIWNTVLVIEGGNLLGTYDKCMLTGSDRDRMKFAPGRDVPVFESHGARFSVVICHDTSFPHPALLAKLRGAEILFTPHYNSIGPQTVDDHRKWVRNCHVGLACLMKLAVVRSNVVVTAKPDSPGYGDSFIMSPQGEIIAGAELFRTELVTAAIGPEMFKIPYVWADLDEVPDWLNEAVAEEMRKR
ncbi:MAG: carbon-nitrogen hydrolase family protein [Candidatus Glassbacteria bacterium]|nr:carbon-nitrogen hydrolase family protein [Candidatus Glassbacteria bacterium]